MATRSRKPDSSPSAVLQRFRSVIGQGILLDHKGEAEVFAMLPDDIFSSMLEVNFENDPDLAEMVILNRFDEIERIYGAQLRNIKKKIPNLVKASQRLGDAILDPDTEVLFITDNDNDGSLAQAVLLDFRRALALDPEVNARTHVEYTQAMTETRGLTKELVDKLYASRGWGPDKKVQIVTADNGINNDEEVVRIRSAYPNTAIIISDHHLPDRNVVKEDRSGKVIVFNPKYAPSGKVQPYFVKRNISGADTLGVLCSYVLDRISKDLLNGRDEYDLPADIETLNSVYSSIVTLGQWANLLDYVPAHPADQLLRQHIMEKANGLRPLLNTSNAMAPLVVSPINRELIEKVADLTRGTDAEPLDPDWVEGRLVQVKLLNLLSRKLLAIYADYRSGKIMPSANFHKVLAEYAIDQGVEFESANPNFIEQLRPPVFSIVATDDQGAFMVAMGETMIRVFEDLRSIEKDLQGALRDHKLLVEDQMANSTILYPSDPALLQMFNRRFLGKSYNGANNGFTLTLSAVGGHKVSGSMRTLYPISELLDGKEEIEERHGIRISFQGHENAAGFFIESTNGKPIDPATLTAFNVWMDGRVAEQRANDRMSYVSSIVCDLGHVDLLNRINRVVRSPLSGMRGVPMYLRLPMDEEGEIWVTDHETSEQIRLSEVVNRRKYGFVSIKTDFHGGAVIVPVEMLRAIVQSDGHLVLRSELMSDGVFMGTSVANPDDLKRRVDLVTDRSEQSSLMEYYAEHFSGDHRMEISREDLMASPYFKFSTHGEDEFLRWEAVTIDTLDRSGAKLLAVVDTEGTGLGRAPKCFNIGSTNLYIDPESGTSMPASEFDAGYVRSASGVTYLLTEEQQKALVPHGDGPVPDGAVLLYSIRAKGGVGYSDRYLHMGPASDLDMVHNLRYSHEDDTVTYNRRISAFASSFLVKAGDFAITEELFKLTQISQDMLNKMGKSPEEVDALLVEMYEKFIAEHGGDGTIIFQAHNMPYDEGVVSANFPRFHALMRKHLISDTAKIAREERLAYDDTPMARITALDNRIVFYASPQSDYSLHTFLEMCHQGLPGKYSDMSGNILFKYEPIPGRSPGEGKLSYIDKRTHQETDLRMTLAEMMDDEEMIEWGLRAPQTAVKYSVNAMSLRATIRNIMLFDAPEHREVDLLPHEDRYAKALSWYQSKYHFDSSPMDNMRNFVDSLKRNQTDADLHANMDLVDFTQRFLDKNRDIQAKFHDGWIYSKVLTRYEPPADEPVDPDSAIVKSLVYETDLPRPKVLQVLDAARRYKEHFGIAHAVVHEEHNNIRQTSESGHGLSDTAYESILPLYLLAAKQTNPFYQRPKLISYRFLFSCVKAASLESMVKSKYNEGSPVDTYSALQMQAFGDAGRTEKAQHVQRMKDLDAAGYYRVGKDGRQQIMQMKLGSSEALPSGYIVEVVPRAPLTREQLIVDSENLHKIVIGERVKYSTNSEDPVHLLAESNNPEYIAIRDDLLSRYESVNVSTSPGQFKKLLESMDDAYGAFFRGEYLGEELKEKKSLVPQSLVVDNRIWDIYTDLEADLFRVYRRSGLDVDGSVRAQFRSEMERAHEKYQSARSRQEAKSNASDLDVKDSEVRLPNFLNQVNSKAMNPMKYVITQGGISFCIGAMRVELDNLLLSERASLVPRGSRHPKGA